MFYGKAILHSVTQLTEGELEASTEDFARHNLNIEFTMPLQNPSCTARLVTFNFDSRAAMAAAFTYMAPDWLVIKQETDRYKRIPLTATEQTYKVFYDAGVHEKLKGTFPEGSRYELGWLDGKLTVFVFVPQHLLPEPVYKGLSYSFPTLRSAIQLNKKWLACDYRVLETS